MPRTIPAEMISHIAGVAFPFESSVVTCAIVFSPHYSRSFRIAAGYVSCTAELLAQTNLSARPQERMSALLPQQAECQKAASQHRLNSKGLRNGESRRHLSRGESLTQGGKQIDAACERNSITPATERLRQTGKTEDIDAGVKTKANKSFPLFDVGRAPHPKKLSSSAERAEAKT